MRMPEFTGNVTTSGVDRCYRSDARPGNGATARGVTMAQLGCDVTGFCPPGRFCCDCGTRRPRRPRGTRLYMQSA